jgi:ligand-binding SRPBCC domain-containing protein
MNPYVLEREQIIERDRSEAFAFFSDAFNLERITPPFLRFRVLTARPLTMAAGTLLEYKLSLFGVGFCWKTIIERWEPEESFVDLQLEGPYRLWRHTHSFESIGQSRTLMRDRVEYLIPLGILGRISNALFVSRTLKEIFDYRARSIAGLLAAR